MRPEPSRPRRAVLRRAIKASLVALIVFGGGYLWHSASSTRITVRAEQARLAKLRMSPEKWAALEREAERDAVAAAFAAKQQAEAQARALAGEPSRGEAWRAAQATGG